jgi:hypothetical protein
MNDRNTWRLTPKDSKRFADALENPPDPADELKKAAERYRQAVRPRSLMQEQYERAWHIKQELRR